MAVRFMKMDFMKMKSQLKLMIFVVIAVILFSSKMLTEGEEAWGVMYMIFMGIIFAATPFSLDSTTSNGFIKLLPAPARSRVYGRFLYSFVFLLGCTGVGIVLALPSVDKSQANVGDFLLQIICLLGAGLIMNSVQYVVCYFCEIKNPQVLSIIRILPGFIFFFAGNNFMAEIINNQEKAAAVGRTISKIIEHKEAAASIFFAISMLITLLCMWICAKREEIKER